jgi:predicted enzyme related to lactoylglutathione lyase
MSIIGGCATLCTMDRADRERADLGAPGNVFYFVADLAAATSWYSARLGVEPVTRAPQLVMFDLPGARLTLHEADGFNQPGPSGTVPYWTVSDVDATVAEWSEYGACAHRGPKTIMTGERLCQMLDPFGNPVRAAAAASLTRGRRHRPDTRVTGNPGAAARGADVDEVAYRRARE